MRCHSVKAGAWASVTPGSCAPIAEAPITFGLRPQEVPVLIGVSVGVGVEGRVGRGEEEREEEGRDG